MSTVIRCFGLLLLSAAATAPGEELTLSRDGASDYVIVVPNEATPVERTAAR